MGKKKKKKRSTQIDTEQAEKRKNKARGKK